MSFVGSELTLGLAFAVLSGLMNGTFTLPMKYLGKWDWENVWSVFIVVSCIAMPAAVAATTVTNVRQELSLAPLSSIIFAVAAGFAWGFGAIMFGQGVSALGISMGNTLVLAISASLGSLLPIIVIAPGTLLESQGKGIILGTGISVGGIILCGFAGFRREQSQRGHQKDLRGDMVGRARPFWVGLLLATGAGLLSAVFNIGYSAAHGIIDSAVRLGNSAFAGSNLIWLLMLSSGAVANLAFCGYLFRKDGSWVKFMKEGSAPLYGLAVLMGLLWGGSIFVYGSAAPKLGKLGPAIGWPLSLAVGLLTANLCGIIAGEWKLSESVERRWMAAGLLVLLAGIATLGWSSTLK
jgi:L-rhamnose-H+ transport protein